MILREITTEDLTKNPTGNPITSYQDITRFLERSLHEILFKFKVIFSYVWKIVIRSKYLQYQTSRPTKTGFFLIP